MSVLVEMLICFVLSDGVGSYAFCSRYDLGSWLLMWDVSDVFNEVCEVLCLC